MSEMTLNRMRAATIALAPILLLVGFLMLPHVNNWTDSAEAGSVLAANPRVIEQATFVLGVAIGLSLAAVFAIRLLLDGAGEDRWGSGAVLLIAVGGTLTVALTSVFAGIAVASQHGGDATATAKAFMADSIALQIVAGALFSLGLVGLAIGVHAAHVLSTNMARLVMAGFIVAAIANLIPMSWALYVCGVAALVAFLPLANRVWSPSGQAMRMGMAHA